MAWEPWRQGRAVSEGLRYKIREKGILILKALRNVSRGLPAVEHDDRPGISAYIVMAHTVMAVYSYGLYSNGLYSYGLYSYGGV